MTDPLNYSQRYHYRAPIPELVIHPLFLSSSGIGVGINVLVYGNFSINWPFLKEDKANTINLQCQPKP